MAIQRSSIGLVLVLLVAAGPIWCMAASLLYSGETLKAGDFLNWGSYQMIMQRDCDLVLYSNSRRLWYSRTAGMGTDCYVTLQSDGNLVVYNNNGVPLWSSQTVRGNGYYVLNLQKDRNLVIYGTARWATNTTI